jgi:hypothetical protein
LKNWRSDWFLIGALCGGISSVGKTLVNLAFYKSKIANVHFVDIAGGMILGKRGGEKPRTFLEIALGTVADTLLGSLFGVSLAWLIGKTPKGYEGTKGALFGTSLWSTTLALGTLLKIDGLTKPKAKTMIAMLFSSTSFGLFTGLLIKRLGQFEQVKIKQPTAVTIQSNNISNSQLKPAAK